jgi:hypothetical protein
MMYTDRLMDRYPANSEAEFQELMQWAVPAYAEFDKDGALSGKISSV